MWCIFEGVFLQDGTLEPYFGDACQCNINSCGGLAGSNGQLCSGIDIDIWWMNLISAYHNYKLYMCLVCNYMYGKSLMTPNKPETGFFGTWGVYKGVQSGAMVLNVTPVLT